MTTLDGTRIGQESLAGWAYLIKALHTRIHTPDYATGLALVAGIGAAAEEADHHPDLDLRYGHLDVRLTSHDAGGVTDRDVALARTITALAAQAGSSLDPTISRLELALDTPDFGKVAPFWQATLGLVHRQDEAVDPAGSLPTVWFQESGAEEPRQRWHLDVWIDPAEVPRRIEAVLAAGGRLVTDTYAPSYWVLADPDGNMACLCTWQGDSPPD